MKLHPKRVPLIAAVLETMESRTLMSAVAEFQDSAVLAASGYVRRMENLDRGVVATRVSSSQAFISWRLLGTDVSGVGFNVYRSVNGGAPTKITSSVLTAGTNYSDTSSTSTNVNTYFVKPVIGGVEQAASESYTLVAGAPNNPYYKIPIQARTNYAIRHINVADLNGDGKFDFIVGRKPIAVTNEVATEPSLVEAYLHDGTPLWTLNLGPNSYDLDNIEPGSTAIDIGHWDGVVASDLDGDGKAEVFLRTANGFTFANCATVVNANNSIQYMSAVNGMNGVEMSRVQIPTDYISDGPLAGMMAVGYLDGVKPSVVVNFKNRIGSGEFNEMIVAYDFNGTITQKWKWKRPAGAGYNGPYPDGHNIRVVDVDQDGKDEVGLIGFMLNGDGTVKYSLNPQGVVHGDRWHVGDFDPARPGLEGYAVQQDNPSFLLEYFYDAGTGQILWQRFGTAISDNGRGDVGDIDPNYPGSEYWSFGGLHNNYNSVHTQVASTQPWPHINIQWDGDFLTEELSTDHAVIDQWSTTSQALGRVTTLYNQNSGAATADGFPMYYGDIIGDWREEVVYETGTRDGLVIFTTNISTTNRLYTLAHNPLYRNDMTTKGYLQSRHTDYFLGNGMTTPANPSISLAGAAETPGTLGAAALNPNQVLLTWGDGGTHETGFEIEFAIVTGGTLVFSPLATTIANATNYTASGLSPLTQYAFRIRAVGQGPDSVFSNVANATTPSTTASISGVVFNDANGNGTTDGGELGIAGRIVFIDTNGNTSLDVGESSQTTSGSGAYTFSGLSAGTYVVRLQTVQGWNQTLPTSNAPRNVMLTAGQVSTSQNFGTQMSSTTEELAKNKPTRASSLQSRDYESARATDGNTNTRWASAASANEWLEVDLGRNASISEIRIQWSTAYAVGYGVEVSADENTWTPIYSTTTGDGGVDQVAGLNASGRYVRIVGTQRAIATAGYSISDFAVYGTYTGAATLASVSGNLFYDANKNAAREANEPAVSTKSVFIDLDADNTIDANEWCVFSQSNGFFQFAGLAAGTYNIRRMLPVNWYNTTNNPVTLTTGQTYTGYLIGSAY